MPFFSIVLLKSEAKSAVNGANITGLNLPVSLPPSICKQTVISEDPVRAFTLAESYLRKVHERINQSVEPRSVPGRER